MRHISGDIYGLLMSQGLSAKSVGADKGSEEKRRGAATKAHARQVAAATGEVRNYSGVRLAWVNPTAMRKRARNKAPLLMVVRP